LRLLGDDRVGVGVEDGNHRILSTESVWGLDWIREVYQPMAIHVKLVSVLTRSQRDLRRPFSGFVPLHRRRCRTPMIEFTRYEDRFRFRIGISKSGLLLGHGLRRGFAPR